MMNSESYLPTILEEDFESIRYSTQIINGKITFCKKIKSMNAINELSSKNDISTSWEYQQDEDDLIRKFPDKNMNLFVGTWNMQRCKIPSDITNFIQPNQIISDIYVIGIQEAPNDIKGWEHLLQRTLGESHVLATSTTHGVLHLSIFVRKHLIWHCSDFVDCKITTRPISSIKTKGAIAISFSFFGSTFLFLNCHFHSGQTKTKERIEDYKKISEELKIQNLNENETKRNFFDGIFWFGDLNFRISQPHQYLKDEIRNATYDISEMIKCDQLTCNMKRGVQIFQFSFNN